MQGKGIASIATAAVLIAGCSGQADEDRIAGEGLRNLLSVQIDVIEAQEQAVSALGQPLWNPQVLARNLSSRTLPKINELGGESEVEGDKAPPVEGAAASVSKAQSRARFAMEQILEPMKGLGRIDDASRAWKSGNQDQLVRKNAEPYGLRMAVKKAERVEPDLSVILGELELSAGASGGALDSIEEALQETGNLGDEEENEIAGARANLESIETKKAEAIETLGSRYGDAMTAGYRALDDARRKQRRILANQLPDGACAKISVPYPSTLGTAFTYVYPSPGITCEAASSMVFDLYSQDWFRETGEGTYTLNREGFPPFECSLGQVSPIGDPRYVNCETNPPPHSGGKAPVWVYESQRVSFEAPATAG